MRDLTPVQKALVLLVVLLCVSSDFSVGCSGGTEGPKASPKSEKKKRQWREQRKHHGPSRCITGITESSHGIQEKPHLSGTAPGFQRETNKMCSQVSKASDNPGSDACGPVVLHGPVRSSKGRQEDASQHPATRDQ
ncbi:hypothetical protein E5288_WYG005723 [Bos mutus]|uniref:Uncharacterized protein n=1 Tax=Bos mutus TaxID=72004 RepID=A0A6B0RZN8_9CETA|nr:hypothetical protein [Bos mutus]